MMKRISLYILPLIMLGFSVTASAESTALVPVEIISDPDGDALPHAYNIDIIKIEAASDDINVTFKIRFSGAGMLDFASAYIELDTDQNPLTGNMTHADFHLGSTQAIGADFYIVVDGEACCARASLYNALDERIDWFTINRTWETISFTIPLSTLADDGNMNVAAAGAWYNDALLPFAGYELVDAAPDTGYGIISPPSSLTISPASGELLTTQAFDLALIVRGGIATIVSADLDGGDVTGGLSNCVVPGTLIAPSPRTGSSLSCSITGATVGVGTHTFTVTVDVNGTPVTRSVTWDVLNATQP